MAKKSRVKKALARSAKRTVKAVRGVKAKASKVVARVYRAIKTSRVAKKVVSRVMDGSSGRAGDKETSGAAAGAAAGAALGSIVGPVGAAVGAAVGLAAGSAAASDDEVSDEKRPAKRGKQKGKTPQRLRGR